MIQEPINAEEFTLARQPRRKSPAACGGPQLLRLLLLLAIGFGLVAVSLNPGRVLSATSDVALRLKNA